MVGGLSGEFKSFKERHHVAFEVAFFFAGFLFDVLLLHRIDSTPLLIHQGVYLVSSAALIFWDHRLLVRGAEPFTGFIGKLAKYRLWMMHFFLGTLLNAFMVFYFRASSGILAFLFLVALSALIVINELPRFRARGPVVRVLLLSFAVTSFLAYLLPVLWGQLQAWQYVVSVGLGALATVAMWRLDTFITADPEWTFRRAVAPGLGLQVVLLVSYLTGFIPPVPLSLKHIGVYSEVAAIRDFQGQLRYELRWQPAPKTQFWRQQSDVFVAERGSKAFVLVRIFAPTRFSDRVQFAWDFYDDQQGWTPRGKPYQTSLSGGNEAGFRTFAYATMGRPGKYRVRVLTMDDREIGREAFTFVEGPSPPTVFGTD
jgi:hypothetical protein